MCGAECRSDAQRNTDGIPVLRRGSRGKGAAMPVPNLRARLANKLTKSQTVLSQMAALQIIGLRQVPDCALTANPEFQQDG